MSDLILPNGDEKPYDLATDITEFTTKIARACREHEKIHVAAMIGVLHCIANDIHHNMIAQAQQQQMAQAALERANAARIQRNN